jgi:hypothetical protein
MGLAVSVYTVNEICWRLVHDRAFREHMKADTPAALQGQDVTENERRAILCGDIAELHRFGAHDFLLGHLAKYGIGGLTWPLFNERMRSTAEDGLRA